jgi:hypothetical protein
LNQSVLAERVQDVANCKGRVLERGCLLADHRADGTRGKINLVKYELVRVLCFDGVRCQLVGGKVVEVSGDDHLCTGPDSRREDMPVIGIRQFKSSD